MNIRLLPLIAAIAGFPASGDTVSIDFISATLAGSPGQMLTFQGSLGTTTSNLGYDAYLNSVSISLAGPLDWSLDATPFLLNAPLWLANGASTGVFDFFSLTIPAGLAYGYYDGGFSLLGGRASDSEVVLGSSSFQVDVGGSPSDVPESSSLLLTAAAIGGVLLFRHRRR